MKFLDGSDEASRRASHACVNLDLFSDRVPEGVGPAPEEPRYAYEVQPIPTVTCRRGQGAETPCQAPQETSLWPAW